ncbi:hypothetical protein K431DRAFT_117383 [Polychaeton citri CBS 116435]|uniref:Uncharacterized protein n=1 Tax=Polychaeton citri CBS 116435 TaxID=1314669 RepID=A0A9P4QF07_9PEZI|nr:hypothetical protein K431DRAFT_117383 [Polychaeton citri CBS 116435]
MHHLQISLPAIDPESKQRPSVAITITITNLRHTTMLRYPCSSSHHSGRPAHSPRSPHLQSLHVPKPRLRPWKNPEGDLARWVTSYRLPHLSRGLFCSRAHLRWYLPTGHLG